MEIRKNTANSFLHKHPYIGDRCLSIIGTKGTGQKMQLIRPIRSLFCVLFVLFVLCSYKIDFSGG